MGSFDAEALFPSVPIADCIEVIRDQLRSDNSLSSRTRLSTDEICDLVHLCLEQTDFTFDDRHHTAKDSGPIGLSLMVTVAQMWMIHTLTKAMELAEERNLPRPGLLQIYMDDCWVVMKTPRRPGLRSSNNITAPDRE